MEVFVDVREIRKLTADLEGFRRYAITNTARGVLNRLAFETQRESKSNIRGGFINRNNYTERSVQVDMARGSNLATMESRTGSVADYMDEVEFGGTKVSKGKEGVPIATPAAANQSGRPRTKLPTARNRLRAIALAKKRADIPGGFKNERQRLLVTVWQAVEDGNRFVFLNIGARRGIFKVVGGRPGTKRRIVKGTRRSGWPRGARLMLIHDLTHKTTNVPRNPWLLPAVRDVEQRLPRFYEDEITRQVERLGLFKERRSETRRAI